MSENRERVRAFIAAWKRSDLAELMSFVADDSIHASTDRGSSRPGATTSTSRSSSGSRRERWAERRRFSSGLL
jgi:hypothetical protein